MSQCHARDVSYLSGEESSHGLRRLGKRCGQRDPEQSDKLAPSGPVINIAGNTDHARPDGIEKASAE